MNYTNKVKPEGCLVKECCNGNNDAYLCASTIYVCIDWIDNVVDGDVKTSAQESAKIFMNLTMMMSFNPFFLAHKEKLVPVLKVAMNAWLSSERLKDHEDYRVRIASDVLKGYFLELFYLIGFITGGEILEESLQLKWRGFDFDAKPDAKPLAKVESGKVVDGPRKWDFTLDHGNHPEYSIEWWYGAGLVSDGTKDYGYHFAEFRVKEQYHLHFSMFDLSTGKLAKFQKIGSSSSLEFHAPGRFCLKQQFDNCYIEVELKQASEVVLQGDEGYSIKSSRPGHASYYYSIPELRTSVRIVNHEELISLEGTTWMDHEFGSSMKPEDFGWVFFFAKLDSGEWINGYLMKEKGQIDLTYSKVISISKSGWVENLSIDSVSRTPSVDVPEFEVVAEDKTFKISMLHPDIPQMQSALGNYLELPCKVECNGFSGKGYLEITS